MGVKIIRMQDSSDPIDPKYATRMTPEEQSHGWHRLTWTTTVMSFLHTIATTVQYATYDGPPWPIFYFEASSRHWFNRACTTTLVLVIGLVALRQLIRDEPMRAEVVFIWNLMLLGISYIVDQYMAHPTLPGLICEWLRFALACFTLRSIIVVCRIYKTSQSIR